MSDPPLALKVDVDTLRGTLEGVPALLALFRRHGLRATFLFSLGPDHTGRALRRVLRPGFLGKVGRTSVLRHYGLKTLLYGTLLPGPDIARHGRAAMRAAAEAGHEVGVHSYDHVRWQDLVARRDRAWTERELGCAMRAFEGVFGRPATTHGAAGWQVNPATLALEEAYGLRYASDCRGTHPFLPEMDGTWANCPQVPTTLPTLDELIGCDGITEDNAHRAVLAATREQASPCPVYTLHAELEGMRLLPVMERLIEGWRAQGRELVAVEDGREDLDLAALPRHRVEWAPVPGRSGLLACQGARID